MSRQNRPDSGQANNDDAGVDFLDFLRSAGGTVPLAHDRSPSQQNQQQRQADQRFIESLHNRRSTPYFSHGGPPRQSRNDQAARDQAFAARLAHHRSARHHYQEQQPQQESTNDSAERKRRHTGLEHARRTHPYPGYPARPPGVSGAGRSSSHNGQQGSSQVSPLVGASVEDAIDLTSSPPSQPRRPGYARMENSSGSGGSSIAQALNAERRRHSERQNSDTLPRWQPDDEVASCPVCATDFSILYRRHHCRKCGRVVCARCSPHRITIPRQYIVQQPNQTTNAESTVDAINPALGGGEVVRVCNPCVPDPWRPDANTMPPQRPFTLSQRLADEDLRAAGYDSPYEQPFSAPTQQPTSADLAALRNELPPGLNRPPSNFNDPQDFDRSFARRNRSQSHQQTSNPAQRRPSELTRMVVESRNEAGPSSQTTATDPQHGQTRQRSASHFAHGSTSHRAPLNDFAHSATTSRRASGNERQNPPPPYQPVEEDDALLRFHIERQANSGHLHLAPEMRPDELRGNPVPYRPNAVPRPVPRRQVAEEDCCPVCGKEMPPGEAVRERHIQECLDSHMAPQSPPPTTSSGSAPTDAPRPRAASFRPRGIAKYVATEKDCGVRPDDGEVRQCNICFEEFMPGDKLVRMGCLCVFCDECINAWWATKGQEVCPTHDNGQ